MRRILDTALPLRGRRSDQPIARSSRALLLVVFTFASGAAHAQSDSCADCHAANTSTATEETQRYHLLDWQLSNHARADVGCASCHGGDTSTFEFVPAHRGVLHSAQPESPTHFANLPTTCGSCHQDVAKRFEQSRHGQLVRAGNRNAPTCTTCHSSVGAFLLSSRGLERQCASCHGPNRPEARPGRAEFARDLHERFRSMRAQLRGIERLLRARGSRDLSEPMVRASDAMHRAAAAAHSFDLDLVEKGLADAEQHLDVVRVTLLPDPEQDP